MFAQLRTSAQRARDAHRLLIDHQRLIALRCVDYGQDIGPHYANQVHARQSFKFFALCRSSARHNDIRFLITLAKLASIAPASDVHTRPHTVPLRKI